MSKGGGFRYQAYKLMRLWAVKPCAPLQINDGECFGAMHVIGGAQSRFYLACLFRNTKFEDRPSPKSQTGRMESQHLDREASLSGLLANGVKQDRMVRFTEAKSTSYRAIQNT